MPGLDALHERLRPGVGDRSQGLDQLLAAHADAVVLDRQAALLIANGDGDAKRRVLAQQRRICDRLVTKLFAGIGRVRNQLTNENIPVGIDRVHDQVQKLGDIGLKRPAFLLGLIDDGHVNIVLTLCGASCRTRILGSLR